MIPPHVLAAAQDVIGHDNTNVDGGLELVGAYYASLVGRLLAAVENAVAILSVIDHPAAPAASQVLTDAVAEVTGAS